MLKFSPPGISIPRNFPLSSNIKNRFADSIPYHINGLLGEIKLYFFYPEPVDDRGRKSANLSFRRGYSLDSRILYPIT